MSGSPKPAAPPSPKNLSTFELHHRYAAERKDPTKLLKPPMVLGGQLAGDSVTRAKRASLRRHETSGPVNSCRMYITWQLLFQDSQECVLNLHSGA